MIEIIPNWHPIYVHFSIGLLLLSVALHVALIFVRSPLKQQWKIVARWTLWLGTLLSIFTVIAGFYAFNTVEHDKPSHAAMIDHRNWALVTFSAFFLLALWSFRCIQTGKAIGRWFTPLLVISGLLLMSTAWHGGELVYRHGLGVMSLPEPGSEHHTNGGAVQHNIDHSH